MLLRNTESDYGAITKTLHWLTAIGLIGLIAAGLYMTDMPNGADKMKVYALHKSFGICVLALTFLRILWHVISKRPRSVETLAPLEKVTSKALHTVFYGFLIALPLSGLLMSSAKSFPVSFFGLFTMPNLISPDEIAASFFHDFHVYMAYVLIAAVALHIAGALKHFFIDHDRVLPRMLPLLAVFLVISVPAQAKQWILKPGADSSITFKAKQMGAEFEGRFRLFVTKIEFDPDNLPASHVTVDIDLSTVDTKSAERDDALRGKEWFDISAAQMAKFETTKITKTGEGAYLAEGSLTIRGVTVPVSLPFTLVMQAKDSDKELIATMDGRVILDRNTFGLGGENWNDTSVIANEVPVSVHIVAKTVTETYRTHEKSKN